MSCWLKGNSCRKDPCVGEQDCQILFKLNYLFDQANISMAQRVKRNLFTDSDGTDLNEFKELTAISNDIVNFVDSGKNLYIYSKQAGNGKTSWSLRLAQTYLKKIWLKTDLRCRALFIDVPTLLLAMKANISEKNDYYQHIKDNVENADLVIWDDIGNKLMTEFEISNLLSMLNSRLNNGKANIYTSNIAPKDLGQLIDVRLASRIGSASKCIEFNGGDKRTLLS